MHKIIEILNENGLIIMPSDTVWGIFGIISKDNNERINNIKGAEISKPISIMFSDSEQAKNYVDEEYWEKLDELGEGMTYILKSSQLLKDLISYETVGVRIVPQFNEIVKTTGPLFTTSANLHGEATPENREEIDEIFKDKVELIVGEEQNKNKASTIISFINGKEVIR